MRIAVLLLAAVLAVAPLPVAAADEAVPDVGPGYDIGPGPATSQTGEGVSAYAVARLKIFEGSVSIRPPGSGEWQEYYENGPVAARSALSVPQGSEGELQFHGGQFMLLTGGTELEVRTMAENETAFELRSGEIRFDLPKEDFAPVRVAIPGGERVVFQVPGRYWLSIGEGGMARLVVRRGEGIVTAGRNDYRVREGEEASIDEEVRVGRYEGEQETYTPPPPLTDYEEKAGIPPAAAYELRSYGDWVYTPEYGYAWRPRVAGGWSPYYYGQWTWAVPFGWTWIAYEPWGWYPYHYGYWTIAPSFGWVWCPYGSFFSAHFAWGGHYYTHHHHAYYHPATVRFVREGQRIRWVPLRPGDRVRRVEFARTDTRLTRWNRPLTQGTVFVREGTQATRVSPWRDWTAVQRERRATLPRSIDAGTRGADRVLQRPDNRVVRPDQAGRPAERAVPQVVRPDRNNHVERRDVAPRRGVERPEAPRWNDGTERPVNRPDYGRERGDRSYRLRGVTPIPPASGRIERWGNAPASRVERPVPPAGRGGVTAVPPPRIRPERTAPAVIPAQPPDGARGVREPAASRPDMGRVAPDGGGSWRGMGRSGFGGSGFGGGGFGGRGFRR